MQDDRSPAPVSEPDDQPAPSGAAAASEPAQDGPRLNTLAEAFRDSPDALKDRGRSAPKDERSDGDEPPEASAPDGKPSDASKSGENTDGPGLSRRGAAGKISEQQAEIDRLVTEREAERTRLAETEARVHEHERQREAARKTVLERIGDDQEFSGLMARRMRAQPMSYEDDEKLERMIAWREHASDLWEMADRAHKAAINRGITDQVEKLGLDRKIAFDSSLPDLVEHVATVTEARVRKELAHENAELKAELKGLRTRTARGAAPTVGGSSDGGGDGVPSDGASPLEWFRAGARRQETTQNGRAARRA